METRSMYWPALDGLRAIAVLAVVAWHADLRVVHSGALGVNVFFVLSGFLITSGLVAEIERRDRVSFRSFYVRRILRLYPALVLVSLACFGLAIALPDERSVIFKAIPTALVYLSNVVSYGLGPLGHTWSLAVEEQFYVVWPICLVLGARLLPRRLLPWMAAAGTVLAAAWRAVLFAHGADLARLRTSFDTQADQLLVGCALALLLAYGPAALRRGQRLVGYAGLVVVLLFLVAELDDRFLLQYAGVLMLAVATAAVIHTVVTGGSIPVLEWRPLVALGRRSYGVYLWHVPILWTLERGGLSGSEAAVGVCASLAAAWLSYRFVEEPILRLKDRFRFDHREPDASTLMPVGPS